MYIRARWICMHERALGIGGAITIGTRGLPCEPAKPCIGSQWQCGWRIEHPSRVPEGTVARIMDDYALAEEINKAIRAIQISIHQPATKAWQDKTQEEKDASAAFVSDIRRAFATAGPVGYRERASIAHYMWMNRSVSEGKDPTGPLMVHFEDLTQEEQMKDFMYAVMVI